MKFVTTVPNWRRNVASVKFDAFALVANQVLIENILGHTSESYYQIILLT